MKNKLWGGRFSKKTNPLVDKFTKSIQFDKKLAMHDCVGSLLHIDILKKANLLKPGEHKQLEAGLKKILASINKGTFKIDPSFEDIHSYIQSILEQKTGAVALKLHTSRSRNDQVVFDTKLYCVNNIKLTVNLLGSLCKKLEKMSKDTDKTAFPGYTHLQHAMPISLGSYFGAYSEMLKRDAVRLENILKNIRLTLGAGAINGTFIDSSKYNVSKQGVKVSPTNNPIDTVSDRDFVIEILSALAIIGMHLSRLGEDFILWSTKEFDFIDIDEAFCTGSSLMPQKKNPDTLELIRGNAGKLYANLMNVLVVMKGLPLSYNRDMQLDKEPLFNSFEIAQDELKILTDLLPGIKFKKYNIAKQLEDEALYATDMADYLVKKGVAFKEAHAIIGKLIIYKLDSNTDIVDMPDAKLREFNKHLNQKVLKAIIDPKASISSKKSVKK